MIISLIIIIKKVLGNKIEWIDLGLVLPSRIHNLKQRGAFTNVLLLI